MRAMPATAKLATLTAAAALACAAALWQYRRLRAATAALAAEKDLLERTVERLTRPGGAAGAGPREDRPLLRACA